MPPKKKRTTKRKRTTKKKAVKANLGDISVDFTKPENVEPIKSPVKVEAVISNEAIELDNGLFVKIVNIAETEKGKEVTYQKGQKQDSGLIEWGPSAKMPIDMFNKFMGKAKNKVVFGMESPPPSESIVETDIPDGVVELNNGCLVKIVGRTDGDKIKYQKGWQKDTGLIEWTPKASMPKEMFYKFLKNMEVKK